MTAELTWLYRIAAEARRLFGPDATSTRVLGKTIADMQKANKRRTRARAGKKRYTGKHGTSVIDVWYDPANVEER